MSIADVTVYKVSCENLERSAEFYAQLDFLPIDQPNTNESPVVARLYGVAANGLRTQMLALRGDRKAARIELIEWHPRTGTAGEAGSPSSGMLGLRSDDLQGDYERLRKAGAALIGKPIKFAGAAGDSWIVHVNDPDGFSIQLLQFVRKD